MAVTSYRLEAWTLPSSGLFEKVVANVPWESMAIGRSINQVPQNTIQFSAGFDRIQDMSWPETNTETLLRCFKADGQEIGNCILRQGMKEYRDNTSYMMTGPGIEEELSFALVYPYDWGATEIKQPDWEWVRDVNSLLPESDFEGVEDPSTSWESGDLEGWQPTPDSGINWEAPDNVEVLNDPAKARTGDWVVEIDADTYHSGIRKTFDCDPGDRIQFTVWIRSPSTGWRITAGMTVKSGYTVHHTNGFVYSGIALAELENVPRNSASNGLPGGSTDGTWQSINIDVTVGSDQDSFIAVIYFDHHNNQDGPIFYVDDFSISGGALGLKSWVPRNSTLTIARTGEIRNGEASLEVVTQGTAINADGVANIGTQKEDETFSVRPLEVGVTYTLGFWVWHNEGADRTFTAVFRAKASGNWYASAATVVPTATWTFVGVEWLATAQEVRAELRVAESVPVTFRIDDCILTEGFMPTTLGAILQRLLTAIKNRGMLTWVKTDGFDGTNDSGGVPWANPTVTVRVSRGRDVTQVLSLLGDFGLEWEMPWNPTASQYELKVYDSSGDLQGMGSDETATQNGKLHGGSGLVTARIMKTNPAINRALAEGEDFIFVEQADLVLEGAFGRREGYAGDHAYIENVNDVADHLLQEQWKAYEVRATLVDLDGQDVWNKYSLGNLYRVQLPPDIPDNLSLRVAEMSVVANSQMSAPRTTVTLRRPQATGS